MMRRPAALDAICAVPVPGRQMKLSSPKAPVYIAQIAHGDFDAAWKTISMDNPLPGICGRVCNHPCERKCRSGDGGDAISIRALKRFITDYAEQKGLKPAVSEHPKRTERIAIIGAGPAGLACGHRLAMRGFGVTIFDSLPIPGGMLVAGIPQYRLPRRVVEREVEIIQAAARNLLIFNASTSRPRGRIGKDDKDTGGRRVAREGEDDQKIPGLGLRGDGLQGAPLTRFASRADAEAAGFAPCTTCRPDLHPISH